MKRLTVIYLCVLLLAGCTVGINRVNLYDYSLHRLDVALSFPDGFHDAALDGIEVTFQNVDNGSSYVAVSDASGVVSVSLVNGLYRMTSNAVANDEYFNASYEGLRISGSDVSVDVEFIKVRTGDIVIKEIYCGGCRKAPLEGNYQSDKYVILHNNTSETQYLDSLCLGTLSPYNSNANSNPWVTKDPSTGGSVFRDFVPVIQAVWQFGGSGHDFPLAPGEDAVVAINGAIDHTRQYPLSVNLSNPDYFVCYNNVYFPNGEYHPSPEGIPVEHYLNVVIKTGVANAYPVSINSPAVVIFRSHGIAIQDFVRLHDSVIPTPGSTVDDVVCVPLEWVMDAVEVFDGRASSNKKRLAPSLDAGFVYQSDTFTGHSLMRRVNEGRTASEGYEVLVDTNNSGNDFYESEKQSLHE
ncbi:MAG: DUF4876 domain-containing protein [Clostridium sp.]|nr:DUF4876 domain-containing protein [Bacteroides sp.]MCM1197896.1 DUF4876 domain-containing protein [Clostridium sp.]